jgi:hypothetical protein
MTYRERRQAKADRLREWAQKRNANAQATINALPEYRHDWAFITQPGHIPARARINRTMERVWESQNKADEMGSRAAGIESQLDSSIYSDDPDAIEAIEARIAENEAKRERMKLVNKLYKKADADGLAAIGIDLEALKVRLAAAGAYWGSAPHLPYELTNLGARIRSDQKRLEEVEIRQNKTKQAAASDSGVVIAGTDYISVTFAEKPDRDILDALRAADFRWSRGSWYGYRSKLPTEVSNASL